MVRRIRKFPAMQAEIKTAMYWCLQLLNDRNQLTKFVEHAWRVRSTKFRKNPSNGSRETVDKVVCSPSQVPLVIDRSKPYLKCL